MTSEDVKKFLSAALAALWRALVIALWTLRELARTAWAIARGPVIFVLNILAALIVLFEEWGWKPLSELLARLARFRPVAKLEALIATLPPYAALLVFALPTATLLPLKFVAMWLMAGGHYITATALFAGAKIASTALIARIFVLTKPALMQIEWFARAYNAFVPWKDHLFALIRESWVWRYGRMVKTRIKQDVRRAWGRVKPAISPWAERARQRMRAWLGSLWPDRIDVGEISGKQHQTFETRDPPAREGK